MRIRPATPADAETIAGFNAAMARETENLELDPARVLAGVRALVADPNKGFYLLAELDGRIAGQTMVTFEWSDWRNACFWWIQSVYVEPAVRGRGVFRALYRHLAERVERDPELCGLRLYVERHNDRARRTYEKLGMRPAAYEMYEVDLVFGR
ncbi:MAG: GNAT family N-acetyltransferase [Bryobacteraceae bacterium]